MQTKRKTLRLLMPQWQGGDYGLKYPGELYPLGARLLAFLAPESDAPLVEVPVEPYGTAERSVENGVVWQSVVLRQVRSARSIIDAYGPDRIIMFGGDCLVNQAPFAYFGERYGEDVGVLWIDAHPDVSTPETTVGPHTHVLGNLLGHGDPRMAEEVKKPYSAEQVLLVGVDEPNSAEREIIADLGLRTVRSSDVVETSDAVTGWIRDNSFKHVVIHVDLDVLELASFRSTFLWNSIEDVSHVGSPAGKLSIPRLTRLLGDVDAMVDVSAFGFTEHLPWDAYHLKAMMSSWNFMR